MQVHYKAYSERSRAVFALAKAQKRWPRGANWPNTEAQGELTPQGFVHLHWHSHRGRGAWKFVTRRNIVCKTVRCRRVLIIPLGGENEVCDIPHISMDNVWISWWKKNGHIPAPPTVEETEWFQEMVSEAGTMAAMQYLEEHGRLPNWVDDNDRLRRFFKGMGVG